MKPFFALVVVFLSGFYVNAQIGVNTTAPDANAVMDMNATNKGLLIPRLSTVQREAMSTGAGFSQGMMVYDTDLDVLFVGYGVGATGNTKWYAMNPWKTEYRTDNNADTAHMTTMTAANIKHGKVGIGTATPTAKLEVNGDIKTTGKFVGNGSTPLGGIIMWSGTVAPQGWALCNGTTVNGYKTPDLRGRFVAGYSPVRVFNNDYNQPGNLSTKDTTTGLTGGTPRVYLSLAEMPKHNHPVTIASGGAHTHGYEAYNFLACGSNKSDNGSSISSPDCNDWNGSKVSASAGSHTHTATAGLTGGTPTLSVTGHENRPQFYTLAYIMRVY